MVGHVTMAVISHTWDILSIELPRNETLSFSFVFNLKDQ